MESCDERPDHRERVDDVAQPIGQQRQRGIGRRDVRGVGEREVPVFIAEESVLHVGLCPGVVEIVDAVLRDEGSGGVERRVVASDPT